MNTTDFSIQSPFCISFFYSQELGKYVYYFCGNDYYEIKEIKNLALEHIPQQSGSYTAYRPEYKDSSGQWQEIQTKPCHEGIPSLRDNNGAINSVVRLYGFEQAWALAWMWLATETARGVKVTVENIRVQCYEVKYEIKASKIF